jgi:ATP-dependent Clp protease adaptor protein ClpS
MSELLDKQTNKQAVKPPAMWNVIMLNDDFTTFEFVMLVLMGVFNKGQEEAFVLTKSIHESGKAVIGQYPKDIAETKREMAMMIAQQEEHPLQIVIEQA